MLFAGALTGGAKAMGELADDSMKQRERAQVREQTIMDRRNELLFEMKAKADMARQEEEAAAGAFNKVAQRGEQIGHERGARELEAARSTVPNEGEFANARITPDMLASMPPEARSIYEKEMGLTDDSELQGLRDQVQASGEVAAPASVRKAVGENYREARKGDKDEKDRAFRAEQEDRKDARAEANNEARDSRQQRSLDAALERASSKAASGAKPGQMDQTEKLTVLKDVKAKADATKPKRSDYGSERRFDEAVGKWQSSDDGKMSAEASRRIMEVFGSRGEDGAAPAKPSAGPTPASRPGGVVGALEREIEAVTKGRDAPSVKEERLRILRAELRAEQGKAGGQAAAPKSSVKDNPSTVSARPANVKTKADYDALPRGARYVAPDGTVRTKG